MLGSFILLGVGCNQSVPSTIQIPEVVVQPTQTEASAVQENSNPVPQKILIVEVKLQMEKDQPSGQEVILTGVINQSLFIGINNVGKKETLISGTEIGRKGYYWAGLQNDLIFIKNENTLQIQEEIKTEEGEVFPHRVMSTFTLPPETIITLK